MKQEHYDIVVEVVNAVPGISASSITLNHAVAFTTFVFIVLQIAYLIRSQAVRINFLVFKGSST
ncbi:hypothetical protein [Delftia acidovorans]|uniref:Uncharacterized protein n=1 Tax=Delftia acidovorans TaxID=80866 RepID=A0AAJ2R9X3_DELAC|nr:hypothetical protein [Delftia acidovorans]MDX4957918.1 hypothetical protein [Delftia acidovorans]